MPRLMKILYGLKMTQKLTEFLQNAQNKKCATDAGTKMHLMMQHIIIDESGNVGDEQIINTIKSKPELLPFFSVESKTEVPIAGFIKGVFVSRRIDRLLINHNTKTIDFIDYKTDTNKTEFIDKYKYQLKEYAELLACAYPEYKINGYILWLHDWVLDKIIS